MGMSETEKNLTREEMAKIEVGHTEISRGQAWILVVMFLFTLMVIPLSQTLLELKNKEVGLADERWNKLPQSMQLFRHVGQARATFHKQSGSIIHKLLAANRFLLKTINDYETEMERSSFLERKLLPPMQQTFSGWTGLGNEQAYLGKDQWLFYRPGLDSVTGPAFLSRKQLLRRSRSGNEWQEPPQPDPLIAIEQFHDQLAERGVALVLLPVPVKASIHPEQLSGHYQGRDTSLQNPSIPEFLQRLDTLGIPYVDPSALMLNLEGESYLHADTHWTPQAMQVCAAAVAVRLAELDRSLEGTKMFDAQPVQVAALGDIAQMLKLPADQTLYDHEMVEIRQVHKDGSLWKSDRDAQVLLLGDSFSNIYSANEMGWGQAAGFAEQLSYELKAPIDTIIQNDAGAHATRLKLMQELRSGRDRLAGKKIVVWEFSARELAVGDWKLIDMKLSQKEGSNNVKVEQGFLVLNESESVDVEGVIVKASLVPTPGSVPYRDHIRTLHVRELLPMEEGRVLAGDEAQVYIRSMKENKWTDAARLTTGQHVTLRLSNWYDVEDEVGSINRSTIDEIDLEEPCWGELK